MQTINHLISAAFSTSAEKLSDDDTPETVGGWDSITQLVLLTSIEDEFNLRFSDDEMTSVNTIGEIRRLVASKTNSAS